MGEFDGSRFMKFKAEPFNTKGSELLKNAVGAGTLKEEDTVLVVERGGERLSFWMYQMTTHHVAQGSLGGLPYLVNYCALCHSATAMVPVIDGEVHHFSCVGILNGMAILEDRETGSYWDIQGECVEGPLKGRKMESLLLGQMTARQALKQWPDISLALPEQTWIQRWLMQPAKNFFGRHGIFPPFIKRTLVRRDTRLPDTMSGVGIMTDQTKRFYPIQEIKKAGGEIRDTLDGRPVMISLDEDGFPDVSYTDATDGDDVPLYLYARWYGFSLTYCDCEIYQGERDESVAS